MGLCQVRTGGLPIVKANTNNERFYQLSYAHQRDSDAGFKVSFIQPWASIGGTGGGRVPPTFHD